MKLDNHRRCDKCSAVFDGSLFANMMGNGELTHSKIVIFGEKYDLCPECTKALYHWLRKI